MIPFPFKKRYFFKSALCHDKTVKHTMIKSAMVLIVDYVLSTVLSPLAQSSGATWPRSQWARQDWSVSSPAAEPVFPNAILFPGKHFSQVRGLYLHLAVVIILQQQQYSALSVSQRPWDFIPRFAKPEQGPEAPSLTPGSGWRKPVQGTGCSRQRISTGGNGKAELNHNGPQDIALATPVEASAGDASFLVHVPAPGARKPAALSGLPVSINDFNWKRNKGLLKEEGYLQWSRIWLSRLRNGLVDHRWRDDHLNHSCFLQ